MPRIVDGLSAQSKDPAAPGSRSAVGQWASGQVIAFRPVAYAGRCRRIGDRRQPSGWSGFMPFMDTSPLLFIESALTVLQQALHDRDSPLRNVQLATVSPDGHPGLRTVVLRGFERSPPRAEVHTDLRASKVRDIASAKSVMILAWSPADQLQLRLEGDATVHHGDEVTHARWDALSPGARKPYGLRTGSGLPVADPRDQAHLPPAEQFEQFGVISVALAAADVLRLGPDGSQTRAAGRFTPAGLTAEWVGP